ncbi:fork head family transcription factor [Scheffersomyces xylosifermentans]|uniref:fork head family transcription factor n=1 Tax=Scheffersomyces xylosifermentans TaxID=1304137 RepID=UPI00315D5B27
MTGRLSMSMSRVPLQEHSLNSNISSSSATADASKVIDTPIGKQSSYKVKMTTPPESIFNTRKTTLPYETPVSKHDLHSNHIGLGSHSHQTNLHHPNLDPNIIPAQAMGLVADSSKSLLLSPAFSSPQQHHKFTHIQNNSSPAPAKSISSTSYIDPSTSLLSESSRGHQSMGVVGANSITTPSVTTHTPSVASTTAKKAKKSKASKDAVFDLHSEEKPPYSYATLIGISIFSNEEKKLTLSQIYQWISDTFKYYKREDVGWQNSIRHNLSLNKAFVKGEKSKDGKGHFWCIKPGYEEQFLKSRSVKKSSYQEVMDQIKNANNKNREETKRSMNAIPSSPNIANDTFEEVVAVKKRKASEIDRSADYDEVIDDDENDHEYNYTRADDEDTTRNDDDDLTQILDSHNKRQKVDSILGDPFKQWDNSEIHPSSLDSSNVTKTPVANTHPPQFVIESPDKPLLAGKNLTYTSSFSCTSNLELSPIRPSETGPLLEPLTPGNNAYQQHQLNQSQHSQQPPFNTTSLVSHPYLYSKPSLLNNHISQIQPPAGTSSLQKTPKSNILKTPLRNLRTPQTNSIMKKLWNSPSYLDDFYFSPLVGSQIGAGFVSRTIHHSLTSYDDDDMILRNYEHNQQTSIGSSPLLRRSNSTSSSSLESSRNLFHDFKKMDDVSSASSTQGELEDSKK